MALKPQKYARKSSPDGLDQDDFWLSQPEIINLIDSKVL